MPTVAGRQMAPHLPFFSASLAEVDPEIAGTVGRELQRQQDEIELIASENMVSRAVLETAGTVLTNKYAEGYPGRRYYGGCQYVDIVEQLAIDRAKKLFGCGFANVQPNSGSQANQGVFNALAQPGDTILHRQPGRRRRLDDEIGSVLALLEAADRAPHAIVPQMEFRIVIGALRVTPGRLQVPIEHDALLADDMARRKA